MIATNLAMRTYFNGGIAQLEIKQKLLERGELRRGYERVIEVTHQLDGDRMWVLSDKVVVH